MFDAKHRNQVGRLLANAREEICIANDVLRRTQPIGPISHQTVLVRFQWIAAREHAKAEYQKLADYYDLHFGN